MMPGTNVYGQLSGARVHDAGLVGHAVLSDKAAFLFKRVDESLFALELTGVSMFGFLDFCSGSIVADIFAWDIAVSAPPYAGGWDDPWRVLSAGQLHDKDIQRWVDKVRYEKIGSTLMQISMSYGGSIALVCLDGRIVEGGDSSSFFVFERGSD